MYLVVVESNTLLSSFETDALTARRTTHLLISVAIKSFYRLNGNTDSGKKKHLL